VCDLPDPLVSIIIPTLNEEKCIGATLEHCMCLPGRWEFIVVDGGSSDATCDVVSAMNVVLLHGEGGRGAQFLRGAQYASGDVLLFLHADTMLPGGAYLEIASAMSAGSAVGGNFSLRFDGTKRRSSFLQHLYPKLGYIGLVYGDSAIFVSRAAYDSVGGFRPYPIFEDLDLIRRLRRHGKMVTLPSFVVTSSRRFHDKSFPRILARWGALQLLFWLGVSPHLLGRYYPHVRE
jgi:rSAM/selenodomain-associated transferase 2